MQLPSTGSWAIAASQIDGCSDSLRAGLGLVVHHAWMGDARLVGLQRRHIQGAVIALHFIIRGERHPDRLIQRLVAIHLAPARRVRTWPTCLGACGCFTAGDIRCLSNVGGLGLDGRGHLSK